MSFTVPSSIGQQAERVRLLAAVANLMKPSGGLVIPAQPTDTVRETERLAPSFGERVAAAVLAQVPHLTVPAAELADICTAAAIRAGILPGPDRCTVHDWCAATGEHRDHYAPYVEAPTPDGLGDPVLMATIMSSDDETPTIGFLDENFTPDQTRARVAELRAHLDKVEALADRLDGITRPNPADEVCTVEPSAHGTLISATIFTPEESPDAPCTSPKLAVWSEPASDADLDLAGANALIRDMEQFVSRLRAMRDHLAQTTGSKAAGA